jgi:hypothetical protein
VSVVADDKKRRHNPGPVPGMSDVEYRAQKLERKARMFDEMAEQDPLLAIEATEAALQARVAAMRLRRGGDR